MPGLGRKRILKWSQIPCCVCCQWDVDGVSMARRRELDTDCYFFIVDTRNETETTAMLQVKACKSTTMRAVF